MPFYVSPEQVMKDRAEYARKNIARGRDLVAMICEPGILIVADNPSRTLSKISEIYDRIAFAAVGKYNEFQMLKVAGVRHADLKGYSYAREDVSARELANAYAQTLGMVFTHEMKPYEVELLVAEVGHAGNPPTGDDSSTGERPDSSDHPDRSDRSGQEVAAGGRRDELYHIFYDGVVIDEDRFSVLGGHSESIAAGLEEHYRADLPLGDALRLGAQVLGTGTEPLGAEHLEVALLDRGRARRTFRRIRNEELQQLLAGG